MKSKLLVLFLLYILVPLIIIPFLCYKTGNWYWLFCSAFYYCGLFIASFKQWIFLGIPFFFCFWYWYTYGLNPSDYPNVYLFFILLGVAAYQIKLATSRFFRKVLPDQFNNWDYDSKVEELNRRLDQYKKAHPNEKITQEIVEKIRTEVFFN